MSEFGSGIHCKDTKFETDFPEKELRGLSPYFHIHVFVSDLYIPMIVLPIQLQKKYVDLS